MARLVCLFWAAALTLTACGDPGGGGPAGPDAADVVAADSAATAPDGSIGDASARDTHPVTDVPTPLDVPSDAPAPLDVSPEADVPAPPLDVRPPSDGPDGSDAAPPTFAVEQFEAHQTNPGEQWIGWTATPADECALRVTSGDRELVRTGLPAGADPQSLYLNFGSAPGVDAIDLTLTCTGPAGVGTAAAHLDDHPPVALLHRWSSPPSAPPEGGPVELCWEVANADACTLQLPEGLVDVAAAGCRPLSVPAGGSVDGTIACAGGESALVEGFSVWSGPGLHLRAVPRFLSEPGEVTLIWGSTGLSDCVLRDSEGGTVATGAAGEASVPVAADETFTVTCAGPDGERTYVADVAVGPRVDLQLMGVSPALDGFGLLWSSLGHDRCALTVDNARQSLVLDNLAPNAGLTNSLPQFAPWLSVHGPVEGAGDTKIELTCTGPWGASAPRTLVLPEPGYVRLDTFAAIPETLPAAGGSVDICWQVAFATTCNLYVVGSSSPDPLWTFQGGGTGCVTDPGQHGAALPITEPSEARLECYGPFDGLYAVRAITVGPTVRAFAADVNALAGPGPVTVSWDTVEMASCELRDDAGVVATGRSGEAAAVPVDATTTFTLACVGVDGVPLHRQIVVGVGPDILLLAAEVIDPYVVQVSARTTPFVDDCQLYFDRADGWRYSQYGVVPGGFYPEVALATWFWDFGVFGPLTATIFCHAQGEVLRKTIVVPAPADLPPRPGSLTVSPEVAAAGPATFHVCWEVTGADACRVATAAGDSYPDLPAVGCVDLTVDDDLPVFILCTNAFGERTLASTLLVGPSVLDYSATPPQLFLDEGTPTSTIAWETSGMVSCTLDLPSGTYDVPTTGSQDELFPNLGLVQPLLTCTDAGGGSVAYTIDVSTWEAR